MSRRRNLAAAIPLIAANALCLMSINAVAFADRPEQGELAACRSWAERVFGPTAAAGPTSYMEVVYEDVGDPLTRGKSWRGTPYAIGGKTYTHGIAFNATKHIRVHLAKPAERFTADVGLENNDDTQRGAARGRGSVTFHALVGNQEVFRSGTMRLSDEAQSINLPLDGATEFELRVGDAGDQRDYDQALWAEATVRLEDGSAIRLQDLPLADSLADPHGFSFIYDGHASREVLPTCERKAADAPAEGQTSRRQIVYRDPKTGLEAQVEVLLFKDFPAVEWVVHLKNAGTADTPIIEAIQALNTVFELPGAGQPVLHWAAGAVASFDDFAPRETALGPGAKQHLQPGGGRSSSQVLPFFNLARSSGGVVVAIGWTGEWAAEFVGGQEGRVGVKAGLARTHLLLHPGEEIRTPRIALLFYEGDRWRGQNFWRRFVLAHHRPKPGGKPGWMAPVTCGNWGGTSAEIHLDNISKIIQRALPIQYYWIDAEWFGGAGAWWANAGNWSVKKDLYPQGFRPLSERLKQSGRELLLWFEPERIFRGTPWFDQHPEWLLDVKGDSRLLNLGHPDARRFLTDFISARIDEFGLGCYRQDFNIDPLPFWQAADQPERQGMTEIRYIEGLYAFWDELLARHPGLIIDNCASGGRRLDLETLGRATPLWRSDGPRDAIAHQCHTWGLLPWVPLSATSQDRASDDYEFRSSMCSGLCLNWWVSGDVPAEKIRDDFPFEWAKRTLEQYLSLRRFYYGDYYPLTRYSQAADAWMAYQFDLPEEGEGMVVALKRPESLYVKARFALHGLRPDAVYKITDLDRGETRTVAGDVLLKEGLDVELSPRPASALLTYKLGP